MKQNLMICAGILFPLFFFFSCNEPDTHFSKSDLSGFVQKGPFIIGSTVNLSELNPDFSATGRVYSTQITGNDGAFLFPALDLASQYVVLQATGFCFNEVFGENSEAQLTLYAIADISDKSGLNVNVLTHLEKPRVEYLLSQGAPFCEAKATALADVLRVFNLETTQIASPEMLSISEEGDGNGILLAISSILRGFRTDAELSEVLATIANDIREDGKLDNEGVKSSLAGHSQYLNSQTVRENLAAKYSSLGGTFQIPDFETYVGQFNENSGYTPVSLVNYPETSVSGYNVLQETDSVFCVGREYNYSFASETTKGVSLKIVLSFVEGDAFPSAYWGYSTGKGNWKIYDNGSEENSQVLSVIESGSLSDIKIRFFSNGDFKFRIDYYEGGDKITRSRIVNVKNPSN